MTHERARQWGQMNERETIFSPCRRYRYALWRQFDQRNTSYAMFIGLNPSTADEVQDDPTIRRCVGFAKAWGYSALCMTNLFAFRSTDPRLMKSEPRPVGDSNDTHLARLAREADVVVAAWGTHGAFIGRDEEVVKLIDNMSCLGVTKHGYPKHPLYLPKTAQLREFP